MTLTIRRMDDEMYQLEADDGTVIQTYNQEAMVHPDDWIDDAIKHDIESVDASNGQAPEFAATKKVQKRWATNDWEYIDDR